MLSKNKNLTVQKGRQYIFCPNHQTHFDGLFTWAALGDKCPDIDGFGCMPKASVTYKNDRTLPQ